MLWFTLILIVSLIVLYVHDHFYESKVSQKNHRVPIKGMIVTGILYYLVSKGLLTKEEEKQLEDSSLDEIEGYVSQKGILNEGEWSELCMNQCEANQDSGFDTDILT
ncbi:hypothetical protein AB685_11590 [Bacillus sp. LL01]|uniref:hypothetical protein n=1 Tax=Bacillus sp. LL01 TaxID=1665556 RepID=UPI00064D618F|nr:hypothetical protein [Bacillus sp. LL01]KMJ58516.1 hypothetical protein AB685_11590 [Bacillus sp. LL01]